MNRKYTMSAALAVITGVLVIASTIDVSAREIRRERSVTGARGGTIERSVTRGEQGGRTVNRNVQGPNGRGYTAESNRACADGACNRSGTLTTNSGKTFTGSSSVSRNEDGTLARQGTVTGPNGGVFNRNCTGGECTGTGTTAAGRTFTTNSSATRNEDGTLARQGTVTGPNGGVFNRNCTGAACTGTGTTAAGKDFTTSSTVNRNEDGSLTRETTVTGPNGGTATYNKTR